MARLVLCTFLLIPAVVSAADFNMDVKTDGITLGDHLMGPKVSPGDLKGHVVVLEFWGIRCGPCLAAMPHIAKLNDDLGGAGLIVIGAHAQTGTPEKVKAVALSHGANFTIVANGRVKDGNDFNGIPHTMVFDHTGKCVYRGHPNDAYAKVKVAVGQALAAKVEGPPTKAMTPLVEGLKKGTAPSVALQKALALSKTGDKDSVEQAKQLVSAMTATAEKQLEFVTALKADDPVLALPRLSKLSADFKGTPPGAKAGEMLAELKKDKNVMAELRCRPVLDKIKIVDDSLLAALKDADPKAPEFQKAQAGVLKQMQTAIRDMKKKYPDAKATASAIEIGEKYGLNLK